MKKTLLLILMIHLFNLEGRSQSNFTQMENEIKDVILNAEKAASSRDVAWLEDLLHEEYRVVANRFNGSQQVLILSKETYLKMMSEGKIGGTRYEADFLSVKISGHTAMADIDYKVDGVLKMHKYLFLIQTEEGSWKIVSDLPFVIQ